MSVPSKEPEPRVVSMRGTFTTTFGWIFASSRPSLRMPSASVENTSAEIGPSTISQSSQSLFAHGNLAHCTYELCTVALALQSVTAAASCIGASSECTNYFSFGILIVLSCWLPSGSLPSSSPDLWIELADAFLEPRGVSPRVEHLATIAQITFLQLAPIII